MKFIDNAYLTFNRFDRLSNIIFISRSWIELYQLTRIWDDRYLRFASYWFARLCVTFFTCFVLFSISLSQCKWFRFYCLPICKMCIEFWSAISLVKKRQFFSAIGCPRKYFMWHRTFDLTEHAGNNNQFTETGWRIVRTADNIYIYTFYLHNPMILIAYARMTLNKILLNVFADVWRVRNLHKHTRTTKKRRGARNNV